MIRYDTLSDVSSSAAHMDYVFVLTQYNSHSAVEAIEKQIVKLEAKQAAEAAKAEAEAKGQELQDKIAELLAAGKSYDEILNMLK